MKMFTKSKLIIAALSITTITSAQTFTGGAKLGANLSNLSGVTDSKKGIDKATQKFSPAAGLFVRYDINNKWAASMELLYSPKGATYEGTVSDSSSEHSGTSTYKYDDKLNYLEIPILFHYKFLGSEGKFRPYVTLGFAAAIRYDAETTLDYTFKGKVGGRDTTISSSPVIYNYYSRSNVDYGLIGGLGFVYDISPKLNLGLDVRYTQGMVDMRETKIVDLPQRNSALSVWLNIGYKLWSDEAKAN